MTDEAVAARREPSWRWLLLLFYASLVIGLSVAWHEPGMRHWIDPRSLSEMGRALLHTGFGPLAVIAGYVVAVLLGMPVLVLTSVGALIFPPWPGMAYAMCGMVTGGLVTYGIGRYTGSQTVDRWAEKGGRVAALSRLLERRGLIAVILVRVLPLAPFIVVNMVAGALRVKLRDFLLGSFIGLIPATVMIFLFMDRLAAAWRSPSTGSFAAVAVCLALLIGLSWWTHRRMKRVA